MRKILFAVALAAGFAASAQTTESSGRVGYVNMEYIISKLPDVKKVQAEMKSTQTQLRGQIDAKSQEVEKQYNDFNANARTMADSVRTKKQAELEEALAGLEKMQQDAEQALQNKQKLYMAPIYLKVNKAIGEVAAENGLSIILPQQVGGFPLLLYQEKKSDVSDLVLAKFGVTAEKKE